MSNNPSKPKTYAELRYSTGQGCGYIMLLLIGCVVAASVLHVPVAAVLVIAAVASIAHAIWKKSQR